MAATKKSSSSVASTRAGSAKKAATSRAVPAKKTAPAEQAARKAATGTTSTTKAAPMTNSAPAKKAAPAKNAAPAKKAAPARAAAKVSAPAKKTAPAKRTAPAKKAAPVVREDENPWTAAELRAIRKEIDADIEQLRVEIHQAESELVGLMRDSGDGAGDDQADAGTKTYEREQEMTVANNAREMLQQNEHALERLADGTYGRCENCGNPIGKLRLQAAPRATLCLSCKKLQERR